MGRKKVVRPPTEPAAPPGEPPNEDRDKIKRIQDAIIDLIRAREDASARLNEVLAFLALCCRQHPDKTSNPIDVVRAIEGITLLGREWGWKQVASLVDILSRQE